MMTHGHAHPRGLGVLEPGTELMAALRDREMLTGGDGVCDSGSANDDGWLLPGSTSTTA